MSRLLFHIACLALPLAACGAPAPVRPASGPASELYVGKVPEGARVPGNMPVHGNELRGQSTVGGPGATQGGYMSTGIGGGP